MKEILISIFKAGQGTISAKRVFGALGWISVLGVLWYCAITDTKGPEFITDVIFTSATLLGLDSVTDIWKKTKHSPDM